MSAATEKSILIHQLKIAESISSLPESFNENRLYAFTKQISTEELTVYIGSFYNRDLFQQNKISIHVLFGENKPIIYGTTTFKKRVVFHLHYLAFDDAEPR